MPSFVFISFCLSLFVCLFVFGGTKGGGGKREKKIRGKKERRKRREEHRGISHLPFNNRRMTKAL